MTDVNKTKNLKINAIEDALPLYAPPPQGFTGKVGVEVELPLYRPGVPGPEIPTAAAMIAMQKELKGRGYDAQLEPAGVLEYASRAFPVADAARLLRLAQEELAAFESTAEAYGFARAPFSVIPTTTRQAALDNMVTRERLQASLTAMQDIFPEQTLNIPLLTTGVQTSFSPASAQEAFSMMYRAYALTPLLIAALNSSSGFAAGDPALRDYHYRTSLYETYRAAGGIAESFLISSSGEELIRNHIEAVFKTKMHYAFDAEGKVMLSTAENPITFEKLIALGLNTQSNYELAESFIYNDVKICNLRDADGTVLGKRLEVRAADSGPHQCASAILLTAALVPGGKTAEAFDALLKDYGFTGSPVEDAPLFLASRRAATYHGGRFMDVAFGRGGLRDLAADVAGLLNAHYEGQGLGPELSRLMEILLTGECDAKRYAAQFPTLESVVRFLQEAPASPMTQTGAVLARKFT